MKCISGSGLTLSVVGVGVSSQHHSLDSALWHESNRQRHTQQLCLLKTEARVDQFAFDTTNLVFDRETNSIWSNRESSISIGGCVEENGICLVRSQPVLMANGSMVPNCIQQSVLPLGLQRANVRIPVVNVILIPSWMIDKEPSKTPPPTSEIRHPSKPVLTVFAAASDATVVADPAAAADMRYRSIAVSDLPPRAPRA